MTQRIGIDLGTTFSAVAYINKYGQPEMIRHENGNTAIPSVINFTENDILIGDAAKERQAFGDPDIASFFKRSMGEDEYVQFFHDHTYTPTDLSAILLKHLKSLAENQLQTTISEAVITVPAYFENKQREETIKAGKKAGLNVQTIINEPTAAALAYGINQSNEQHLIVYDLGGGTFDVTVVKVSAAAINVLATDGDHSLGGKDWDDCIVSYVAQRFEDIHGVNPLNSLETMNELHVEAERIKKMLSVRTKAPLTIVYENIRETFTITRELFEQLTSHLMERTWNLTRQTLWEAHLEWEDISDVLLVGGSTRMPMVHDYIDQAIGKPPLKGVHPDEAVALGAAIRANMVAEDETEQPTMQLGASKNISDVMSHSMGLITINEEQTSYINSILLYKNEPIPAERKRPYQIKTHPQRDNEIEVYVTQGESEDPFECTIIGKYRITNINHQPNHQAEVEITYAYDHNGVIQIKAKDLIDEHPLDVLRDDDIGNLDWLSEPPEEEVEEIMPVNVVIEIDLSGSMAGRPLKKSLDAANKFISEMDLGNSSIGLIGFANDVKTIIPLTDNPKKLSFVHSAFEETFHSKIIGRGNLAEPFTEANKILATCEGRKFLIVLTDGRWQDQQTAVHIANHQIDETIEVIAIGFGYADERFLAKIATTDEHALFTDETQLVSSFSKIAQEITHTSAKPIKKSSGLLRLFR